MAAVITCPRCDTSLRTANPVAPGKKLTCPKCKSVFQVPARAKPSAAEDEESRPRRRGEEEARERVPTRPARDVVEDDAPPRERPGAKQGGKKRQGKGKGSGVLIAVLAGAGVLLLAGVGVALFFILSGPGDSSAQNPGGGGKTTGPDGQAGGGVGAPGVPSSYDDGLTKYFPEGMEAVDVIDLHAARANPTHAKMAISGVRGISPTYLDAKSRIVFLEPAGVREESIKSITKAWFPGPGPGTNVIYVRFADPPDPKKYVEAFKCKPVQVEGRTYYEMDRFQTGPSPGGLRCVSFAEPDLYILAEDVKYLHPAAEARKQPAVSPYLVQALKLSQGPLPWAARAPRGVNHEPIGGRLFMFRIWTGKKEELSALSRNAASTALWTVPEGGGMRVYLANVYADEKTAAAAEAEANNTVQATRAAYAEHRGKIIASMQAPSAAMFEGMRCARDGTAVAVSWPFDAVLVGRYLAR